MNLSKVAGTSPYGIPAGLEAPGGKRGWNRRPNLGPDGDRRQPDTCTAVSHSLDLIPDTVNFQYPHQRNGDGS